MPIYRLTIEGRLNIPEEETGEFQGTKDILQGKVRTANDYRFQEALRELDNCPEITIKLVEDRTR